MSPEPRRRSGSLARTAIFGSGAQIVGRGSRALIGVATVAVLSRFLSPAEFGLFALVFFVAMFAQLFADFGLRGALVQRRDVTPTDFDTIFWVSALGGLLVAAGVYFGADLLARLFDQPETASYIRMSAAMFLFASLNGVPLAVLEREFRFQSIAVADVTGALVGAAVAIALAMAGFSVEALVAQLVVTSATVCAMNAWSARWRPGLRFSLASLKAMVGYGAWATLSAAVQNLSGYIDRPLVGARLSAADLGFLSMSQQIVRSPVLTIASNVRRVTFPILSSIQDQNDRIAQAHSDTLHAMMLVLAPICLGVAAVSVPMTAVLLGPQWGPVAPLVGIAAFGALAGAIGDLNASVFASKGKARFLFGWSLFSLAVIVAALFAALPYGVLAIAWARTLVTLIKVPLNNWFMARLLDRTVADTLKPVARPMLSALLMFALVSLADRWFGTMELFMPLRLVLGILLGVLSYAGFILLIDREQVLKLANRVRARRAGA